MTRDEKLDAMTALGTRAMSTEVGYRLFGAATTDAVVTRIVGADNPDGASIAKGMSKQAIIEATERELAALTDDEKASLADTVTNHVQTSVVAAVRHSWTVCEALGYDPAILHPEAVAWLAAVLTIPLDAMDARPASDDPTHDEPVP